MMFFAFRNNYTKYPDSPTYLLGIWQIQVIHDFYKLIQILRKPGIVALLLPDTALHLSSGRAELQSVLPNSQNRLTCNHGPDRYGSSRAA